MFRNLAGIPMSHTTAGRGSLPNPYSLGVDDEYSDLGSIFSSVKKAVSTVTAPVAKVAAPVAKVIPGGDSAMKILNNPTSIKTAVKAVVSSPKEVISDVKNTIKHPLDPIKDSFSTAKNMITDAVKHPLDPVKSTIKSAVGSTILGGAVLKAIKPSSSSSSGNTAPVVPPINSNTIDTQAYSVSSSASGSQGGSAFNIPFPSEYQPQQMLMDESSEAWDSVFDTPEIVAKKEAGIPLTFFEEYRTELLVVGGLSLVGLMYYMWQK